MKKSIKIHHLLGIGLMAFGSASLALDSSQSIVGGNDYIHTTQIYTIDNKSTLHNVRLTIYAGKKTNATGTTCRQKDNLGTFVFNTIKDGARLGTGSLIPKGYLCMVLKFQHDGQSAFDRFVLDNVDGKSAEPYPSIGYVTIK